MTLVAISTVTRQKLAFVCPEGGLGGNHESRKIRHAAYSSTGGDDSD